jgi:TolB protein
MDTTTRQSHQTSTAHNALPTPVDWSPDGQRIVYVTENGLSVADVATGAVTELQSSWTTPLSNLQGPVFSPDGTRIAFSAVNDFDDTSSTYVVDATDGQNLQILRGQATTPTDWLNK